MQTDTAAVSFKKGDVVNIINCSGHRFICEGQAKIVRPVPGIDSQYIIKFINAHDSDETYERFVSPEAQGDNLEAFLARLNAPRPIAD